MYLALPYVFKDMYVLNTYAHVHINLYLYPVSFGMM